MTCLRPYGNQALTYIDSLLTFLCKSYFDKSQIFAKIKYPRYKTQKLLLLLTLNSEVITIELQKTGAKFDVISTIMVKTAVYILTFVNILNFYVCKI